MANIWARCKIGELKLRPPVRLGNISTQLLPHVKDGESESCRKNVDFHGGGKGLETDL